MKGMLLVIAVAFGGGLVTGKYLFRGAIASPGQCLDPSESISQIPEEYLAPLAPAELLVPAKPQFQCDGRQHCSQMKSKAEAQFFLANCPDTKMDGDNDGDACEMQFGK